MPSIDGLEKERLLFPPVFVALVAAVRGKLRQLKSFCFRDFDSQWEPNPEPMMTG
jgi:hypothetical protein